MTGARSWSIVLNSMPHRPRHRHVARLDYARREERRQLHKYAREIYLSHLAESTRRKYSSHEQCYRRWCKKFGVKGFARRGGRMPVESLCLYMADFLMRGMSSSSLPTMLSALKKAAEYRGVRWIDSNPVDKAYLANMLRGCRNVRPPVPRRCRPITLKLLFKLQRAAGNNVREQQYMTMAWVAYGALLRMGELLDLRVGDVLWEEQKKRVCVLICNSKANKRGAPEKVFLYEASDGSLSPHSVLAAYWDKHHLGQAPRASMRVFPKATSGGRGAFYSHKPFVKDHLIKYLRQQLATLRVRDSASYTGHSFRSGGATDLFQGGLDVRTIKLIGRWASDAVWIYIRTQPEQYQESVTKAFLKIKNACR